MGDLLSYFAVLVADSLAEPEGGGEVLAGERLEVVGLVQPGRDGDIQPGAGRRLSLSYQG